MRKVCDWNGLSSISSHSFRRTQLTELYREGWSLSEIQHILGRKSLQSLQEHLEIGKEKLSASFAKDRASPFAERLVSMSIISKERHSDSYTNKQFPIRLESAYCVLGVRLNSLAIPLETISCPSEFQCPSFENSNFCLCHW